jgi:two-component system, OmpR family, sensor kinase
MSAIDDDSQLDSLSRVNNELMNLHRELTKANAELVRAVRQKNEVLGMAAHDLRNPLAVILTYSSLLEKDAVHRLTREQHDFVTVIKQTSGFMLRLINDLLDAASIEAGELRLLPCATDLRQVLRDNVKRNRLLAAKKRIAIELREPSEARECSCDAAKIEQVLNNLLGNAFKFARPDTHVQVQLRYESSFATVSVHDEGPGIPQHELPKLFQAFSTTSVRSSDERSTGLGLAIARKIVEGHGGRIWVESEVGQGSTFSFALPFPKQGWSARCSGP